MDASQTPDRSARLGRKIGLAWAAPLEGLWPR
jgi:hypothetical protein